MNREIIREKILTECKKDLSIFQNMSPVEIYEWMCKNFNFDDDIEIRMCSLRVYSAIHDNYKI